MSKRYLIPLMIILIILISGINIVMADGSTGTDDNSNIIDNIKNNVSCGEFFNDYMITLGVSMFLLMLVTWGADMKFRHSHFLENSPIFAIQALSALIIIMLNWIYLCGG